ncbi:phosphatase PAP2 family protein [Rhizobium oryzicola]|uniref:Phosphatase PAP2 family protein n=1 Tax=Rhizobium oryzicola TaxID=1232668 RepID=A0ABT8T2A5_9HYPH|nr:phosphatase PAP2 family protein [Rhizobium oryzicola]MDO1584787.1 phosphatase PAP2 family protein [Rhizobium oryzicola]
MCGAFLYDSLQKAYHRCHNSLILFPNSQGEKAMWNKLKHRYLRHRSQCPVKLHGSFLAIAFNLVVIAFFIIDVPVANYVAGSMRTFGPIAAMITDFGKSGWILIAAALIFIEAQALCRVTSCLKSRFRAMIVGQTAAYLFFTVAASGLLANLIKRIIGRARPLHLNELGFMDFSPLRGSAEFESFPSGHSTTVGALMMAMALLAPAYRTLFLILAIWLGLTRVLVGAHYTSDVIAGLAFGGWFSVMTAILFARCGILFRENGDRFPVLRRSLPIAPVITASAKEKLSADPKRKPLASSLSFRSKVEA